VKIIGLASRSVFLQDNPTAERAYHDLVALYRRERRLPEAERLLSSGIAQHTQYQDGEFADSSGAGPLCADLALVYLDHGQLPQATQYFKSALRWGGHPKEAAEVYAQILDHEGRKADAASWRRGAGPTQ
jgi:hypothetical protein